jgi:hypothetical protein
VFAEVFVPWLQSLAADADFRLALCERLICGFPVANRASAAIFLDLLPSVACAVPPRLAPRLLAILAAGIRRPGDDEFNGWAFTALKSPGIARIIGLVQLDDAAHMLEVLVAGGIEGRACCAEALAFVVAQRPDLVREFVRRFHDREAAARCRWAELAESAGCPSFSTGALVSDATVARLAASPEAIVGLLSALD